MKKHDRLIVGDKLNGKGVIVLHERGGDLPHIVVLANVKFFKKWMDSRAEWTEVYFVSGSEKDTRYISVVETIQEIAELVAKA